MAPMCDRIGELVIRIQEAYLDTPDLTLSLGEAQTRFGLDELTCRALFDLLRDAGVLTASDAAGRARFRLRRPSLPPTTEQQMGDAAVTRGRGRGGRTLRAA